MKITGRATEMNKQDTQINKVTDQESIIPLTSKGCFQAYLDIVIAVLSYKK
jgi:hypothetical protein